MFGLTFHTCFLIFTFGLRIQREDTVSALPIMTCMKTDTPGNVRHQSDIYLLFTTGSVLATFMRSENIVKQLLTQLRTDKLQVSPSIVSPNAGWRIGLPRLNPDTCYTPDDFQEAVAEHRAPAPTGEQYD
jgi:hypothetical protein